MGVLILACGAIIVSLGCGAANLNSAPNIQSKGLIRIAISPSSTSLAPNGQEHFTATVTGASNSAVNWSTSEGSISPNGMFTSPSTGTGRPITITAVSVADPSQRATGVVTIVANTRLSISTSSLTQAFLNTPYDSSLSASGGTPPYSWTVSAGSLPAGLKLATNGSFLGMPTRLGKFSFTATVTDAASSSVTQAFTLDVSAPVNGNFDGPAELPRVYLHTTMADTPAPGAAISVKAGDDLQAALDNANCGDTISLQAGAVFTHPGVKSFYTLPAKACDDQHWIIIRTSTPDASLPPEGTRITPCYAGVASLPYRPSYPCTQPKKLLATLTYPGGASGPISFDSGANHYRLVGLEVTRTPGNGNAVVALIGPIVGGSTDHIVLDRLYIHGTPRDETRRGVALSGSTNIAVQDSYISDLHCNVQGACGDSQAVSGGIGSLATGPIRIVDNFLEAAGENIIFGGGSATQTPADIEIRLNHFFKPMSWLEGQPGFVSPAFIVKNHFELKNAQRVLFDSNILENTWGGFTQAGFSVLLTPRNQLIGNLNVCPVCQVTDITIRNITIGHVGGVFQIANPLDAPGVPLAGQRYSIHDVIVDDIDQTKYAGFGLFAQVSTIASPVLQDVAINHVTAFPPRVLFNVGGPIPVKMPGFKFANSIVTAGDSALTSTGAFGSDNCANIYVPITIMQNCFSGYVFSSDAILASPTQYPPSKWPTGNFFFDSPDAVGFVDYRNGNGGDYHLLPSSPAKGAASDGKDLGADVDAVLAAVADVR